METVRRRGTLIVLLAAALVLSSAAWLRGAEYDEQYTLFLTGRITRPVWPADAITAREVRDLQSAHAGLLAIARDLRATDVHPPLYFWWMRAWRGLIGDSLFAARLASVLFSLVTLWLVATIADFAGIPPAPAMLLTLGCYGFAYTGVIARGFALAQMLSVAGVALLLRADGRFGRPLAAGMLFGAATFANYLAAFVACAVLGVCFASRRIGAWAFVGFAVWLPADAWFFLAQRRARAGQFAPFDPVSAAARLARFSAASVFGGLPLYVDGLARTIATIALALLLVGSVVLIIVRWHRIATPRSRAMLAAAAVAPPIGLLLLGVVFDSTPIELRYLAFAMPFVALLLAASLPSCVRYAVLAVQAVALFGLMTRPETMQPARMTAAAAAPLVGDGVVLVPYGNDGVGIVGAFATEAPSPTRLLVIGRDDAPIEVGTRAAQYRRVVLALLAQDAASRATLPILRQAFADPCWCVAGEGFNVLAFDRVCQDR